MREDKPEYESIGERWKPDSYSNIVSTGSGKISDPELADFVNKLKQELAEKKKAKAEK